MYDAKLDYCVARRWRRAEMLSPVPHRGKKNPISLESWNSLVININKR